MAETVTHRPEFVITALELSFMGLQYHPLGRKLYAEITLFPVKWLFAANDPKH